MSGGRDGHSGSDRGTGSEHSQDDGDFVEEIKETENAQNSETNHSLPAGRSEWDSDGDKVSQSESAVRTKQQEEEDLLGLKSVLAGWNSDSDSENITGRISAMSEKEEGEASSESDRDALKNISRHKVVPPSSGQSEQSSGNPAAPEKHKSKKKAKRKHKHKRRSVSKTSHHSKDKTKNSKRKKLKLKESFHWQPPLEFGEEDDEDESRREKNIPARVFLEDSNEPENVKDQHLTNLKKNPTIQDERGQQRSKETTRNSKNPEPHQSDKNSTSSYCSGTKEQQSLDDMDICTPEHIDIFEPLPSNDSTVPEPNPEATSKSSNTTSNEGSSEQINQPITASSTTADSLQDEPTVSKPLITFKWKPIKGTTALQNVSAAPVTVKNTQESQNRNAQGVKMEIKSKSLVRPGSLFDEVRKTARLNQRPRNQESSSEESSPVAGKTRETSRARSLQKARSESRNSRSASSHRSGSRGWSRSYSRSRSRSRSSSYSSRSRSRSRRRHRRGQSRSRSSTYRSYRSHRGHSRSYSRSLSRSRSYHRHRGSRSDSYDSYTSRSRSGSRWHRRSDSYRSSGRRSRSYHSSSRSSSRRRSHSRSSRYS
ncbi:NK-tumor recognition protein [Oryzias melastigma]|uniref:NK-tumor recognition protein n=1 Tax=Oryzias melastigma TaxID=30732 RepID=A0A834CCW6_ORYME|nr:NK-tumor recognition protein [Oryzias melastigma]